MLTSLIIRDIVLIEKLHLEFGAGLSVLTGETGTGKSILLDALALALGARGDSALVRGGMSRGEVTAIFEIPELHPAIEILRAHDIPVEENVILRRMQSDDGRTKAFVNDSPVGAKLLRAIGAKLIEIHGQHDERALVDPASHRLLLDAFGGHEKDVLAVQDTWDQCQRARRAVVEQEARIARAGQEEDYLRHVLEELVLLNPEANEEDALAQRRQTMMQAEKVVDDLKSALDILEGDGAYSARLGAVLRKLERRLDAAPELLKAPVDAIERTLSRVQGAMETLHQSIASCAFEVSDLDAAEERLFALRGAARKHNVAVADLPALKTKFETDLAEIDAGAGNLARLRDQQTESETAYRLAAEKLSVRRARAGIALSKAIQAELAPLRLERARFDVHIETLPDGGSQGHEKIEFWVQTNPGTAAGPLMKIASGGELSRFLLALKVVLADKGSAPTLIFDEVDAAIGGAVADAVGQRMARLAENVQVLTITHAPQVAARAQGHFLITKEAKARDAVQTQVAALQGTDRREELARMLAGAEVTDEARAAADRLIG